MKWVTALHLSNWAHTIGARTTFPGLVGDMIRATAKNIDAFRFPSGDKGQVRGFDGFLEAGDAAPWIPEGRSVWEFGVTEDSLSKALTDITKRANQLSPEALAETTFVFVSPHTWDNPQLKIQDYERQIREQFKWKGFKLVDGSQLETWLEDCPAVASRFAKVEFGRFSTTGLVSTDQFWDEYSSLFSPNLTESVLLCDRDREAAKLIEGLIGGPASIFLAADSPDEVIAFAVAAIRQCKPELRLFLESKTLIVESEEAIRSLSGKRDLVFLPRGQARHRAGMLAKVGATLVAYGGDQPKRECDVLTRPTSSGLGKALVSMGFSDEKGYELARSCGRSVTILARMIPGGAAAPPEWQAHGPDLLPALLAGGWSAISDLDKQILSDLASGQQYDDYESKLQRFTRANDPPIDRVMDVWKMRAPVDAFVHLGHRIGAGDLSRLRRAVHTVFSMIEAPPDPDTRFSFRNESPTGYSEWLRDGLASTLLQIAVLYDQAGLTIAGGAQRFVNEIIDELPGLKSDHRLLSSLSSQLPILAEAAPLPLLAALEQMLEGEATAIRPIFDETPGFIGGDSHHTGLLWALETIAWDPELLNRASVVLAKLAAVDPGGTLSNRPINSLRAIHVTWSPNTNASWRARISCLDTIIQQVPEIAWSLVKELLPKYHDTSSPTAKPRHREDGEAEREVLTYGVVWAAQGEVVARAIRLARSDATRLGELLEVADQLDPTARTSLYAEIGLFLDGAGEQDRSLLISKIQKQVNHHRAFSDAEWAMKEPELADLDGLLARFPVQDPTLRNRWLFDEWLPDIPGPFEGRDAKARDLRERAIDEIYRHSGLEGILNLATQCSLPHFVATASAAVLPNVHTVMELISESFRAGLNGLVTALSSASIERFGQEWHQVIRTAAIEQNFSSEHLTDLVLFLPDSRSTWNLVSDLGEEVERNYWTRKPVLSPRGSSEDLRYALEAYVRFGRPSAVIEAVHGRNAEVDATFLLTVLDETITEINSKGIAPGTMFVYHLENMFENLGGREDVSDLALAQREYAYLPGLQRSKKPLRVHNVLASDPQFYVSILCDVYKARSAEAEEAGAGQQERARIGYQLLASFRTIPGASEEGLDFDTLASWVTEVVSLATEKDRSVVAQLQIGHLLAHAQTMDGIWPPEEIGALIEEIKLSDMERGIETERFNMRGVFSKAAFDGGDQERALAEQYRDWASHRKNLPRTEAMLKRIAVSWERNALHSDEVSKLDQLKF